MRPRFIYLSIYRSAQVRRAVRPWLVVHNEGLQSEVEAPEAVALARARWAIPLHQHACEAATRLQRLCMRGCNPRSPIGRRGGAPSQTRTPTRARRRPPPPPTARETRARRTRRWWRLRARRRAARRGFASELRVACSGAWAAASVHRRPPCACAAAAATPAQPTPAQGGRSAQGQAQGSGTQGSGTQGSGQEGLGSVRVRLRTRGWVNASGLGPGLGG